MKIINAEKVEKLREEPIKGCTYGDTKFSSEAVCYGINLVIDDVLKEAVEIKEEDIYRTVSDNIFKWQFPDSPEPSFDKLEISLRDIITKAIIKLLNGEERYMDGYLIMKEKPTNSYMEE